ncbi:ABC transporter substrate-binding protein [Streptomyces hainanensis]|uniref:ABC transporter substrate-binding protein n=1 Tax=Streptomyces hainanensis TaxID=402648 RepID=UPI0014044025|nr:extracellular solute-binding protein [Streptomyces hainanensis]
MHRQRRRVVRPATLFTVLLFAGSLAACGGSGGSGGSGGDDGTLTLWTFKQSHVAALQAAADAYREESGVAIEVEAVTPDEAFVTRTQAAAQTGDLPDLFETHIHGDDFTFGGAGLLEDLSDDVTDEWLSRYSEAVRDAGTVTPDYYEDSLAPDSNLAGIEEGQRFSVPLTMGTFGIVYADAERLAQAGVTEPPATWEEFIDVLAAVDEEFPENGGLSVGLQSPTTGLEWILQPMAYGQLGQDGFEALFSDDANTDFASPDGRAVLENYGEIQPYWTPGTQTLPIDQADLSFAQGESSFLVGGTFTLAFLEQNGFDTDNLMTFPVPAPSGGAIPELTLAPFGLTGLSVSATTGDKEGALGFLEYMAAPDVAADFAQAALDVPSTDLGDDPTQAVGPVLGQMMETLSSAAEAYNPGDTTYKPSGYDGEEVAALLMEYTPLARTDAAGAGGEMADLITSYWNQQR